jgi:hypothetical protein
MSRDRLLPTNDDDDMRWPRHYDDLPVSVLLCLETLGSPSPGEFTGIIILASFLFLFALFFIYRLSSLC